MEKLTLQQVQALRKAQDDLIFSKSVYLEFYSKMAKHVYTTDLNNLIRGNFQRVDVPLNIPKLPPQQKEPEEYIPMLQLDKLMELYDAAEEGRSFLQD
ncbi:PREDICTED: uncharacterized protein LOC108621145 [Drosophila arizonae]|uniref:Uncharacterized protein LOC108621145 n=1 Tax=Drosophila arizonae TaxID=7263 RepID=A0ABM1Q2V4_DROAR|nr:PREDICTED: uncharacterized protein LOC108621145 [Drosophila arizonae]